LVTLGTERWLTDVSPHELRSLVDRGEFFCLRERQGGREGARAVLPCAGGDPHGELDESPPRDQQTLVARVLGALAGSLAGLMQPVEEEIQNGRLSAIAVP
jgi:hypothetical protein